MSNIEKFKKELITISEKQPENYIGDLYDAVELVEDELDISSAYKDVFEFFSLNRDEDLGNPGPLVHLLEKHYPMYVTELINVLKTDPTYYTIFMLNRFLSLKELGEKRYNEYLSILKNISTEPSIDDDVAQLAKELLSECHDVS